MQKFIGKYVILTSDIAATNSPCCPGLIAQVLSFEELETIEGQSEPWYRVTLSFRDYEAYNKFHEIKDFPSEDNDAILLTWHDSGQYSHIVSIDFEESTPLFFREVTPGEIQQAENFKIENLLKKTEFKNLSETFQHFSEICKAIPRQNFFERGRLFESLRTEVEKVANFLRTGK